MNQNGGNGYFKTEAVFQKVYYFWGLITKQGKCYDETGQLFLPWKISLDCFFFRFLKLLQNRARFLSKRGNILYCFLLFQNGTRVLTKQGSFFYHYKGSLQNGASIAKLDYHYKVKIAPKMKMIPVQLGNFVKSTGIVASI